MGMIYDELQPASAFVLTHALKTKEEKGAESVIHTQPHLRGFSWGFGEKKKYKALSASNDAPLQWRVIVHFYEQK